MTHYEIGDSAKAACGGEGFLTLLPAEVTCVRCRRTRYFRVMDAEFRSPLRPPSDKP